MADGVHTITLGGKIRQVPEPVFRQLRLIIPLYRQLATASAVDSRTLIIELLAIFFEGQRLGRLANDEISAFIAAVPDLCGLTPSSESSTSGDDDWGSVYAHLSASLGWDYDYIDNHMMMSRLKEMAPYFKRNPPTHQLVVAFLGYEYQDPQDKVRQFFQSLASKARH